MILACNYEETTALTHGARALLDLQESEGAPVAAPSTVRVAVESLLPRLTGDISVRTLAEQRQLQRGVAAVVDHCRVEMEARVLASHPADEAAVGAYFEFAHVLAVLGRIREMGEEMQALIEVMTGEPPTRSTLRNFVFPD
jgi:ribosomal protein S28E/S33